MIGYVRGAVSHLFADACFVDVQGVGYRVLVAAPTRRKLAVGREAMLFTYLNVREDALQLYGFATQDEYDLFMRLTSVSGIGPKVALGVLSAIAPDAFYLAVSQKKTTVLTKLPGIGKKTAERLILELYDKVAAAGAAGADLAGAPADAAAGRGVLDQAAAALAALGYTPGEVSPVLKRLQAVRTVEEAIKLALKELGGKS